MILAAFLLAVCSFTVNGQITLDCSRCVCVAHIKTVSCRGIGLTHILPLNAFASYSRIDLSNNSLTTVHARAFQGMTRVRDIDLSDNALTSLDSRAFKGAENITKLSLRNNHLTEIPASLNELNRLESLDIVWNPIQPDPNHFSDAVMYHLGSTLKELHFGHPSLYTWPQATSHLQALEILELDGASIAFLPPSFSNGFSYRLKSLTIKNTQMQSTPILSSLRNLETLHLDDNPFHDYGIIETSFIGLNHLKELSLNHDLLTTFPSILRQLPALNKVALDGNSFFFISDDAITIIEGTQVTELSLKDCNLDRVPGSITGSTLDQLRTLDLSFNNIHSIERFDLSGLNNLINVSFAHNPLHYVSTNSLNLTHLEFLDMSFTKLTTVPKAVKNLPQLKSINLMGNYIECTCDLIWFEKMLKQPGKGFDLQGQCETIERDILRYLEEFIPKCPDYHESN